MADIRIRDLPTASPPVASDFVAIDNGTTRKTDLQTLVETGRPSATQAEAEAGVESTKVMTPLTTKQAVEFYGLTKDGNLSGITNAVTARTNLGLGSAAVASTSDFQPANANLTTLAGVTPGAAGLAILADVTQADVRDYLDTPSYVATRTALKALDTTKDTLAYLTESGREGIFKWTAGDFSTNITTDTAEGVFIKADAIASTAGAWVRIHDDLDVRWFGAVGDGSVATSAFSAAISLANFLGYNRIVCKDSTKSFKIIELQITADLEIDLYGGTILGDFGAWGTSTIDGTPIYWTKNVFFSTAANAPSVTLKNMTINGQNDPAFQMIGGTPIVDFRGAASPGRCVISLENFILTRASNRRYTSGSGITSPTLALDFRNMEILVYNADEFWAENVELRSSPGEMLQVQSDDQRTKVRVNHLYATKARDQNPSVKWSNSALNVLNCHTSSEMRNSRFFFFTKGPCNWENDGGLVETCEFDFVDDSNGLDFNEAGSYRFNQLTVRNCFFKDIVNVGIRCSSTNTLFDNNTFEDVNICISYEGNVAGDPAKGSWLKTDDQILANNIVRNTWCKSMDPTHTNRIVIRALGASASLPVMLTVEGGGLIDRQSSGNKPLYGVYGQHVNLKLSGYFADGTTALVYLNGTVVVRGRDCIFAPQVGESVHTFHLDTVTLAAKAFVLENVSRITALDAGNVDFRVDGATFDIDGIHVNGSPNFDGTSNAVIVVSRDGYVQGTATFDPPSIAAGASTSTTITVTGARLADRAVAFINTTQSGLILSAYVSASNTVTVTYFNPTAAAIDLASHTVTAWVKKPLTT